MAYQGGGAGRRGSYEEPAQPYPYAYNAPEITDSEEHPERVPLTGPYYTLEDSPAVGGGRPSPFYGPFDDSRPGSPGGGHQSLPPTLSNESVSALGSLSGAAPMTPYENGSVVSLSSRNTSVDFDGRRQTLSGMGIRRKETRRVKIRKGQALSIEYEVPSAVANAIQETYRAGDLETGSKEFTHIRCMSFLPQLFSCS